MQILCSVGDAGRCCFFFVVVFSIAVFKPLTFVFWMKMVLREILLRAVIVCSFLHVDGKRKETVILVSFDGFRWDYLDMNRTNTDHFNSIVKGGVRAKYVRNVFPTVTFPNHYTIVTGLYPESHGIISNSMYDPIANATFSMRTNDSKWWNKFAEPLWVTTEKQGQKSGMCYWPGYDVDYKGCRPSFTPSGLGFKRPFADRFNDTMPWKSRVDLVMSWLKNPDPPTFVTLYFNSPDEAGHCCGPDSVNVTEEIRKDNEITGYLLQQLDKENLLDKVNVIVTADHGTGTFNSSTVISIEEFLPSMGEYTIWVYAGSYFLLNATDLTRAYNGLKKAEQKHPQLKVYRKEELPEELHFKHNNLIPEIIVIMDEGWIARISDDAKNVSKNVMYTRGAHGWMPSAPSMHPFFIARGPAFKQGYKSGPIDMVDIYPLICHLLNIEPLPNNGSLDRIAHLLKVSPSPSSDKHDWLNTGEIIAVVIGSAIAITVCVYAVLMVQKDRRHENRQQRHTEVAVPLLYDGDQDNENVL